MTAKPPTPQGISARYHYVITLQFEMRDGIGKVSWESGHIIPKPGQTRGELFLEIFRGVAERSRKGANPVPLFFSLEPDDLTDVTAGKADQ